MHTSSIRIYSVVIILEHKLAITGLMWSTEVFKVQRMNVYLLGGSIVFWDGIPEITVATNSGVTFGQKLNEIKVNLTNIAFDKLLYSLGDS